MTTPPKTDLDKIFDNKKSIADEVKFVLQELGNFDFGAKETSLTSAEFFDENAPKPTCDVVRIGTSKAEAVKKTPANGNLPQQQHLPLTGSAHSTSARQTSSATTAQRSSGPITLTKVKGTIWEYKRAEAIIPTPKLSDFLKLFTQMSVRSYTIPDMPGFSRVVVYNSREMLNKYEDNKSDIPF